MPICQYLHISMKLEFIGLIANSEVALGYSRLGRLKSHLVTCQPPLIANHQRSAYRRTSNIKIHVAAHVDVFPLVSCLNFSALFPKEKRKNLVSCSGSNSTNSVTLNQYNSTHRRRVTRYIPFLYFTFAKTEFIYSELQAVKRSVVSFWAAFCQAAPQQIRLEVTKVNPHLKVISCLRSLSETGKWWKL